MSYRILLEDRDRVIWAVESVVWEPPPDEPTRRVPVCERKPYPEHQGVGFESLEMAQQIVQYLTLPPSELRLFRIDDGEWPTSYQRADRAVAQAEVDRATLEPWRAGMRGPRGPLIPGE
jgi:hypothetical protein